MRVKTMRLALKTYPSNSPAQVGQNSNYFRLNGIYLGAAITSIALAITTSIYINSTSSKLLADFSTTISALTHLRTVDKSLLDLHNLGHEAFMNRDVTTIQRRIVEIDQDIGEKIAKFVSYDFSHLPITRSSIDDEVSDILILKGKILLHTQNIIDSIHNNDIESANAALVIIDQELSTCLDELKRIRKNIELAEQVKINDHNSLARSINLAEFILAFALIVPMGAIFIFGRRTQNKIALLENDLAMEQARLIQAAKLSSLGEMAAGIMHEINNPLAVISGNLHSARRSIDTPQKILSKIEDIQKATDRLRNIVDGLKKFSRKSASNDFKTADLNKILSESIYLTSFNSINRKCTVEIESCPTDISIFCNDLEIEQVLVNLINNALDAVKDLDNRWVKIKVVEDHHLIYVKILDSGSGISESVQSEIFRPFFTTKPTGEGTGLGLSISNNIMTKHHGSIRLETENGHTCFTLVFPQDKVNRHSSLTLKSA